MKLYSIFLFVILAIPSFSQTQIEGILLEKGNGAPISFANIFIKGTSLGTTSNDEGKFTLYFQSSDSNNEVVFSCIGYASKSINIKDFTLGQIVTIYLDPVVYSLQEITIHASENKSLSAEQIVANAIQNIKNNYTSAPIFLHGFYRQTHLEDKTYTKLVEAAVTVYDPGYQTELSKIKVDIDGLRRSYDARILDKKTLLAITGIQDTKSAIQHLDRKYHSLGNFVRANPIRKSMLDESNQVLGAVGPDFLKKHKFKLDSTLLLDEDLIYKIKILPNRRSEKIGKWGHDFVPIGWLYIRESDFAIVEMEYSYVANPKKEAAKLYTGTGIFFRNIIKFKDYNGKLCLNYFSSFSMDQVGTFSQMNKKMETGFSKGFFYVNKQFLVTSIQTNDSRDREWNEDLYGERISYSKNFWDTYNILLETSEETQLRTDLEKKVTLDEQFKKN